MRKTIIALTAAALGLGALPALAVDNGIYLGGSVGQAGVSIEESFEGQDFDYDADSTAFKAIVGWRFLDWLAVEGNYIDLGLGRRHHRRREVRDRRQRCFALGRWLPAGRTGRPVRPRRRRQLGRRPQRAGETVSDDGTDLTYGVGAQFRVWSLSIRAEYEQFDVDAADTVDLISVGVTWTFL